MAKTALIGYTGFVGTNLALSKHFDGLFNSKNIEEAYETPYDLVVYSGVRAEKFLANQNPEKDLLLVEAAIENIKRIKAGLLVLISTIDVYSNPQNVDENTFIETSNLQPYGLHRYFLEKWVQENVPNSMIVRLPALYGENIKKNFIFDMIKLIPSMIRQPKFAELTAQYTFPLGDYYVQDGTAFYKLRPLSTEETAVLKGFFELCSFNALSFTDMHSQYQFYPLSQLWYHLEIGIKEGIKLMCLNSEPISAMELYEAVYQKPFTNRLSGQPPIYDLHSIYPRRLGLGKNDYWFEKSFILEDIKQFVHQQRQ